MAMKGTFYTYDVLVHADDVPDPGNYFIYPVGFNSPKCVPLWAWDASTGSFPTQSVKKIFPELEGFSEVPEEINILKG